MSCAHAGCAAAVDIATIIIITSAGAARTAGMENVGMTCGFTQLFPPGE